MADWQIATSRPYGELYDRIDDVWGSTPGRLMSGVLGLSMKGHAVDLGCGEGRNTFAMVAQGFTVLAVDCDPVAIQRLDQRRTDLVRSDSVVSMCSKSSVVYGMTHFQIVLAYGLLHCLDDAELDDLLVFCGKQAPGTVFAGSALTSELPIPNGHGTVDLYLRSANSYRQALTRNFDVAYWETGTITESHEPVVGRHTHSSAWFIARVR
ncbi:methyltransferase domain-containing protein [Aeromicrobium fastidiosum]|uniref:methyltransferase domain-containing protein n=1 Tax=Aeromicrobium fastidiosum TaxID=52699 RepID=UPI001AE27EBE|nr:methyltransferase domain-containing protein [Aeromicrobium fastidiosum]MBP2392198.1 SAM-dependent methyltransferase [Aeromicrobium fastidiosum]